MGAPYRVAVVVLVLQYSSQIHAKKIDFRSIYRTPSRKFDDFEILERSNFDSDEPPKEITKCLTETPRAIANAQVLLNFAQEERAAPAENCKQDGRHPFVFLLPQASTPVHKSYYHHHHPQRYVHYVHPYQAPTTAWYYPSPCAHKIVAVEYPKAYACDRALGDPELVAYREEAAGVQPVPCLALPEVKHGAPIVPIDAGVIEIDKVIEDVCTPAGEEQRPCDVQANETAANTTPVAAACVENATATPCHVVEQGILGAIASSVDNLIKDDGLKPCVKLQIAEILTQMLVDIKALYSGSQTPAKRRELQLFADYFRHATKRADGGDVQSRVGLVPEGNVGLLSWVAANEAPDTARLQPTPLDETLAKYYNLLMLKYLENVRQFKDDPETLTKLLPHLLAVAQVAESPAPIRESTQNNGPVYHGGLQNQAREETATAYPGDLQNKPHVEDAAADDLHVEPTGRENPYSYHGAFQGQAQVEEAAATHIQTLPQKKEDNATHKEQLMQQLVSGLEMPLFGQYTQQLSQAINKISNDADVSLSNADLVKLWADYVIEVQNILNGTVPEGAPQSNEDAATDEQQTYTVRPIAQPLPGYAEKDAASLNPPLVQPAVSEPGYATLENPDLQVIQEPTDDRPTYSQTTDAPAQQEETKPNYERDPTAEEKPDDGELLEQIIAPLLHKYISQLTANSQGTGANSAVIETLQKYLYSQNLPKPNAEELPQPTGIGRPLLNHVRKLTKNEEEPEKAEEIVETPLANQYLDGIQHTDEHQPTEKETELPVNALLVNEYIGQLDLKKTEETALSEEGAALDKINSQLLNQYLDQLKDYRGGKPNGSNQEQIFNTALLNEYLAQLNLKKAGEETGTLEEEISTDLLNKYLNQLQAPQQPDREADQPVNIPLLNQYLSQLNRTKPNESQTPEEEDVQKPLLDQYLAQLNLSAPTEAAAASEDSASKIEQATDILAELLQQYIAQLNSMNGETNEEPTEEPVPTAPIQPDAVERDCDEGKSDITLEEISDMMKILDNLEYIKLKLEDLERTKGCQCHKKNCVGGEPQIDPAFSTNTGYQILTPKDCRCYECGQNMVQRGFAHDIDELNVAHPLCKADLVPVAGPHFDLLSNVYKDLSSACQCGRCPSCAPYVKEFNENR